MIIPIVFLTTALICGFVGATLFRILVAKAPRAVTVMILAAILFVMVDCLLTESILGIRYPHLGFGRVGFVVLCCVPFLFGVLIGWSRGLDARDIEHE